MPVDLLFEIFGDSIIEDGILEATTDTLSKIAIDGVDIELLNDLTTGDFSSTMDGIKGIEHIDSQFLLEEFRNEIESIDSTIIIDENIDDSLLNSESISEENSFSSNSEIPGEVNGFENSDFGTNNTASKILGGTVPEGHIQGLDRVNYQHTPPEIGVLGDYNSVTDEINLYNHNLCENIDTFRHEIGHRVFNNFPEINDFYKQAIMEEGLNPIVKNYPSDVHIHESFAEDYNEFLKNPTMFKNKFPMKTEVLEYIQQKSFIT